MKYLALIFPGIVFVALAAWTWRACPHPLVDFGRECYGPWRLASGEVLYRDFNHFNGPLSQYFNAIIFKIAGANLTTLKITNLLIAALTLGMIVRVAGRLCDRWAAISCGIVFCTAFAFNLSTPQDAANFNWITPYSHELTHGIALSLAMLRCLRRGIESHRPGWMIAAGLLMGLTLLTKAEVMLAAALGAGTMLVAHAMHHGKQSRVKVVVFLTAAVTPVAASVILLAWASDLPAALRGIAGSWMHVGNPGLMNMTFFRWMNGSDDYARSMTVLGVWLVIYLAGLLVAFAACIRARGWGVPVLSILAAVGGFGWVYLAWTQRWASIGGFLRPLPLVLLGLGIWHLYRKGAREPLILPLIVFSAALLVKIVLNVQSNHYGFALAMPGTMIALILLQRAAGELPGSRQWILRCMMLGMLAMPVWVYLRLDARNLKLRSHPIGEGADRFLVEPAIGVPLGELLNELAARTQANDRLAVLPDGAMLNFLSRRQLPGRHYAWTPPGLVMFGEADMLNELRKARPQWLVLAHFDAHVYDAPWFGIDYAQDIQKWIDEEYVVVGQHGAVPFTSPRFGATLLTRSKP